MRILVTGASGRIGRALGHRLRSAGHAIEPFDLTLGSDVRDARSVARAAAGRDAIVHLATAGVGATWEQALTTDVLGMHHVLGAAAGGGVPRVVQLSSLNATGTFLGKGRPLSLPIDEDHPCVAAAPYGGAKRIVEELCDRHVSTVAELSVVSLRPPAVWFDGDAERALERWEVDERLQWRPFWEYGAFVAIDDLLDAIERALACPISEVVPSRHAVLNVAAPEIAAMRPTLEMVDRLLPGVAWRGEEDRDRYVRDPWRSLIDSSRAASVLGWEPPRRFDAIRLAIG